MGLLHCPKAFYCLYPGTRLEMSNFKVTQEVEAAFPAIRDMTTKAFNVQGTGILNELIIICQSYSFPPFRLQRGQSSSWVASWWQL